jgi:phage gp46-like protein
MITEIDNIFVTNLEDHWNTIISQSVVEKYGQTFNEIELKNAVLISILTDARAAEDDELPDPLNGDRRGWWGDNIFEDDTPTGSKFWLYERSKTTQDVIDGVKEALENALQWMIDDGYTVNNNVITGINVDVQRQGLTETQWLAYRIEFAFDNNKNIYVYFNDNLSGI